MKKSKSRAERFKNWVWTKTLRQGFTVLDVFHILTGKNCFWTLFSDFIWILISNLKNGETESVKNRVQRNGKKLGFQFSKNLIFHDFSQNWSLPNVTNFLGCNFFAAAARACVWHYFFLPYSNLWKWDKWSLTLL